MFYVTALIEGNLLCALTGCGCAYEEGGLRVRSVNAGMRMVPGEHESYQQKGWHNLCFTGEGRRRQEGCLEDNTNELFGTPLA